jgi:RNA-directed DNA polymerase
MDGSGTNSTEETEARLGATPAIEDWTHAPWRKLERHVYRLQRRIYRAQQRGNLRAVPSLQRLLLKSRAARMLAVRRVSQDNAGKKTAGVDGVRAIGPMVRLHYAERLRHPAEIKAQPVRRVMIPKANKPNECRPLGIPVMLDRAHQALVKLALEPQWEARFEPHSYGFRPGRCCQDAIAAIYTMTHTKAKFVLDADIKGCFDNIDKSALLRKLDTTPAIGAACKAWLDAGVMIGGAFTPTPKGCPQGGVISPLLMNVALHGLEARVTASYSSYGCSHSRKHPQLIRYADDLVVLHEDLAGVLAAKTAAQNFLATMGLEFSVSKTRISHTLAPHEGNVGFDFLGYTVRQYRTGRGHSDHSTSGAVLGFTTRITPSKNAVSKHMQELGETVRRLRTAPQDELIATLNKQLIGWTYYYRNCVASATFARCDHVFLGALLRWAKRRHPREGARWVVRKYWCMVPGRRWDFTTGTSTLAKHAATHIRRHIPVRGSASPYDGDLLYWAQRLKEHPLTGTTRGKLLQRQHGRCAWCGLLFEDESDLLEVDQVLPATKGGTYTYSNMQLLHRHCHDQKSASDGSHH